MSAEAPAKTLANGRYSLGEVLGSGGAATVYAAHDSVLDMPRAIKVLHADRGSAGMRRRMFAEAKAMARLIHPNVLRIWDVGHDDGIDYVVMDLATGGTLSDRLSTLGPMPPTVALQYTIQILAALAAAHNAGIVHRDVKPQNVLLDHQGTALLADFGIALVASEDRGTRTGIAMGSVAFMPPEQRLDARSVGAPADIYSAGATLYALLTARNPVDLFTADERSGRFKGLPPDLVGLIRRATDYNPDNRYGDARQMASDVLALLAEAGEQPLRAPTPNDDEYFPLPSERVSRSLTALTEPGTVLPPPMAAVDAAITYLTEVGETPAPAGRTLIAPDDDDDDDDGYAALLAPVPAPPLPPVAPDPSTPTTNSPVQSPSTPAEAEPSAGLSPWTIGAMVAVPLLLVAVGLFLLGPRSPITVGRVSVEPADPLVQVEPADPVEDVAEPAAPEPAAPAPAPKPATPAPQPTAKPAPAPDKPALVVPTGPPPLGVWTGSLNGRKATFRLGGSVQAIVGTVSVSYLGNTIDSDVTGSFNADSRVLTLDDVAAGSDAGTYSATLDEELKAMKGTLSLHEQGRVVPLILSRD